jgi:hypothetical protein
MRFRTVSLAAALFAVTALPAHAQIRLDMNKITCGDFLRYSKPDQDFVRFWLSGYYNAAANNDVFDYDRMQRNTAIIGKYCQKNKKASLPTAIKNALEAKAN